MPKDKFWLNILAKHYNVEYEGWGVGGSEVHEAYHKLLWSMKDFKKGDLIIFEFTDHERTGINFNNRYITTASLPTNEKDLMYLINFNNQVLNLNKNKGDYASLYEFATTWAYGQMFYHYWMVWNLLEYLKNTVGIDFILLSIDQTWTHVIPKEHYINIPYFPAINPQYTPIYQTPDPTKNISLSYFCWDHGTHVGNDERYKDVPGWHVGDGHPGESGNAEITKYIIKHITEKWDETNPWNNI